MILPAHRHAGLGRRLGARTCDVIILAWLIALIGVEIGIGDPAVVLLVVISFALEVVPVAAWGLSPGKALLRIRVVDAAGPERVGLPASVLRGLVLYGPVLILPVGAVIVALNLVLVVVHGRGLHDFAARTIVIPIDDSQESPT